jgi:hypothetical protein
MFMITTIRWHVDIVTNHSTQKQVELNMSGGIVPKKKTPRHLKNATYVDNL